MKKVLLLILTIMLLTGCDKKEEKRVLNVLNWSSYIPSSVITNFEKETGIKVNYMTYSSNEELLAKISMAKQGTYDLIFPSDYMVEIMISRGVIEPIDKDRLNNIDNLDIEYMNMSYDPGNLYTLPFIATSTVLSVNREIIEEEINSYNDLLNPKYKDEIVLIDDQRIIIGMALLANGFDMNSTDTTELRIAKNWLLKLKDNVKAYDSDSPKNFLISKEASLAVLWNAEGALANLENNQIENIFPIEGTALTCEETLLRPESGRNVPNMTKKQIEKTLCEYLGCTKVLWIPEGIYNDETNGHIDNICSFVRPGEVVLAWTDDKKDPQYAISKKALEYLESVTDAKGRKLKIHKMYVPKPILITKGESEGVDAVDGTLPRQEGDRLAASYVNYYTGNGFVALPVFNDPNDEKAIELLKKLYPDRVIEPIYAREILLGGGNIHCITQQVPKGK